MTTQPVSLLVNVHFTTSPPYNFA